MRAPRHQGGNLAERPVLQVGWAVPAALAAIVTLYLAVGAWESAHDPSAWLSPAVWWREWLRPNDDGIVLACLGLWLLAAFLYCWPRRKQSQDLGLIVVAAMVAIGGVLGSASLLPCRGRQSHLAVTSWVLQLYVGQLEPRYGTATCPGHLPLALQLGRTVCLAATMVGALAAASVLWRQPLARLRARLVKDAMIVTGLDPMTIPLLRSMTAAGRRPSRVVIIEPDQRHPLLEEAKETGAQVVVADPASEAVLTPLFRGLRGPQLRYLFALRPEAAENDAVLLAARNVLESIRAEPDRPPHLIARIDDPRHAEVWRGQRIGSKSFWFEDALSPQESTASTLLDHVAGSGARRIMLCGDSTLALAVLLELARRAWESKELTEAAGTGQPGDAIASADGQVPTDASPVERVVILDPRAKDLRREFLATSPPSIAHALPSVKARTEGWRTQLLTVLDDLTPTEADQTAVLIVDAPSEGGLHEAGRVARLHPDIQVFVLTSDGAGVTGAAFDKLRPFQRGLLINGAVPDDSWMRIARHWHEIYRLANPAGAGSGKEPTRRPWERLGVFFRDDNILQLRSIMKLVAAQGSRRWVPAQTVTLGSFVELGAAEVLEVAREEHGRWYKRRRRDGWRAAAAGEEDDDRIRVNSIVRPWSDLLPAARERSCRNVRSQLAQLEAVGFMPVLPEDGHPDAQSFRRIGEIRARRLMAGKTWNHESGGVLTASPGDWLVIDDDGNERAIRDREFRATHTPLNGDRWRRTGTVRAWQARETTVLRTLEGQATAQPHDWIVQGPHGERWPVTDEHFARVYRSSREDSQ
jgi:Trk K+ transport system NAD-binding subunit